MSENKILRFKLLNKKSTVERWDILPIPFTIFALYYNFGRAVFNQEEILAVFMLIIAITFHCCLFLLNFWSVNAHVFIAYSKAHKIEDATHVKVK